MSIEPCYLCGQEARLTRESREVQVGARAAVIDDEFMKCSGCGEIYYLPGGMEATQRKAAEQIRRQEGLLMPDAIRSLRESLGLTQTQLEQVLNVGPKTVVRWEKGTVFQSGAVNTLLLALSRAPQFLRVIAEANRVALPEAVLAKLEVQPDLQGKSARSGAGPPPRMSGSYHASRWRMAAMLALATGSGAAAAYLALRYMRQEATPLMASEPPNSNARPAEAAASMLSAELLADFKLDSAPCQVLPRDEIRAPADRPDAVPSPTIRP